MNPDRQPLPLEVARVEWVPSSLDSIEVRVLGAWHGASVPPPVTLLVGSSSVAALPDAPVAERPPAWSAAFVVPSDARAPLEAGEAALDVGEGTLVALPAAEPGRMDPVGSDEGVVVDPAVLAERRARRAELAEESASQRAASAEEAAETLRAQLGHLEERLARAGAERDTLAARVADAERQLRLAEQRGEAERRRRAELEEEVADDLRVADASLTELREKLAGAEEIAHALELELAHARRRQDEAERAADAERAARRALESELAEARSAGVSQERVAELEAQLADQETLRAHADELERRLAATDTEELTRLRARTAELEARLVEADPAEVRRLRARAADVEAQVAQVAGLRARAEELERVLAAAQEREEDLRARVTELDALRAQIAEQESGGATAELTRLRAHTAALERRLAEPSEREVVLAERIASLEAELDRRIAAQERVTAAVATVRDELATVQAQVDAGRAGDATLRTQIAQLEDRQRELEAAVEDRERQLADMRAALAAARTEGDEQRQVAARAELRVAELAGQLAEERARREAAEARPGTARRADLETRLQELATDLAAVRDRFTTKTTELERRLAEERARREAAEARLLGAPAPPPARPPAPPVETPEAGADPFVAAGGDALDALVAGLRAEVAAARAHLEALDEPEVGAPPPPGPEPVAPRPPAIEDETRERLQAIEAELRAAVPDPSTGRGAGDVIASLQHAADRLRAAAQEELARAKEAEDAAARAARAPSPPSAAGPAGSPAAPSSSPAGSPAAPSSSPAGSPAAPSSSPAGSPAAPSSSPAGSPAAPSSSPTGSAGSTSSPAAPPSPSPAPRDIRPLAPRPLGPLADETPWLRRALDRQAVAAPRAAAALFAALLPTQALAVDRLAYDVIVPELGPLRVRIADGAASVHPVDSRGEPDEVEAVFEGDLAALAPLAAGGAGWWLRNVRVREGRRQVWRLARARRAPVTLADLARSPQPPDPGAVLPALASAVDPAWTVGYSFSVDYRVDGDGAWRVQAHDGAPLTVGPPAAGATATVHVSGGALYPLLAGIAIPSGERLDVEGNAVAADTLHGWFDRARGLART